jgi:predicted nucleic acid-binding protein
MINRNTVVVADADILVALYFKNDVLHNKVTNINKKFLETGVRIIFPNTAIAEGITTLHRKLSNSTAAALLNQHYKKRILDVEYIDEQIMQEAAELYAPEGSKKNTFFDAIVAAVGKSLNADAIFSFDRWYEKAGFKLASDL